VVLVFLAGTAMLTACAETSVPFNLVRERIVIQASINGLGPYPLLVDLNQPHSVVSADVAEALKLPQASSVIVKAPDTGTTVVDIVQVQALGVGEARLGPLPCAVLDLSPLSLLLGAPAAGIISGRDLALEVILDFAGGTLVLRGPADGRLAESDDHGVLSLNPLEDGRLTANVLINGKHLLPLELDTTFPGVIGLPESVVQGYGLIGPSSPRLEVIAAPSEPPPFGGVQFRLDSVKLGAAVMRRPMCSLLPAGEPGRLGIAFMKQCRLTVNFSQALLGVESGSGHATDPPVVGCGLTPARCVNGIWNVWVARDSPAERAGIAPASVLLRVGDHSAVDASFEQIMGWLEAPEGENIRVLVGHEGQESDLTLVSEKLL
jgi:hypothetical protein